MEVVFCRVLLVILIVFYAFLAFVHWYSIELETSTIDIRELKAIVYSKTILLLDFTTSCYNGCFGLHFEANAVLLDSCTYEYFEWICNIHIKKILIDRHFNLYIIIGVISTELYESIKTKWSIIWL